MSRFGILSIEDVKGLAEFVFEPVTWCSWEAVRAAEEDCWEVRASAKAFDYYAVLRVLPGSSLESKEVELRAMVEQMQNAILGGAARLRKGYPRAARETAEASPS